MVDVVVDEESHAVSRSGSSRSRTASAAYNKGLVDILDSELGMLGQDVFDSQAVCEHRQHGRDREAQPSDAGQAAHDSRIRGDAFVGHHRPRAA